MEFSLPKLEKADPLTTGTVSAERSVRVAVPPVERPEAHDRRSQGAAGRGERQRALTQTEPAKSPQEKPPGPAEAPRPPPYAAPSPPRAGPEQRPRGFADLPEASGGRRLSSRSVRGTRAPRRDRRARGRCQRGAALAAISGRRAEAELPPCR